MNRDKVSQCEICAYYDIEDNGCTINLDEDDMAKFMGDSFYNCSYFSLYDEYKIVRKQN